MKKIIKFPNSIFQISVLILYLASSIIYLLPSVLYHPLSAFAQTQDDLLLIATSYETREDLDVLFANSTRVLKYLEGVEVEKPIFLSLVSKEQKQTLVQNNFAPQIIDTIQDPEAKQYILLYHPEKDQSSKLTDSGEVYQITRNYTLLKLPPNATFETKGATAEFFRIPFSDIVVSPPLRTKRLELSPTPQTPPITTTPIFTASVSAFVPFTLLFVFGSLVVFFLFKKKILSKSKKKRIILLLITIFIYIIGVLILNTLINTPESQKYDLEIKNDLAF